MYKLLTSALLLATLSAGAQNKKTLDSIDEVIIKQVIEPAAQQGGDGDPAWAMIGEKIKASYSENDAERAINKAQIYYYFGKDWPKFCSALVRYTEKYEDKNDAKLMNKNAQFILQHSENPAEWKVAQNWIAGATAKDPTNAIYKATADGLAAKMASAK